MTFQERIIILCVCAITATLHINQALAAPHISEHVTDDTQNAIKNSFINDKAVLGNSTQWTTLVNCSNDSEALIKAIEYSRWATQLRRFTITGACSGPIVIQKRNIEISNDDQQSGSIVLNSNVGALEAVKISNSTVVLRDVGISVEAGTRALTVTANSTATLSNLTTDAKSLTNDLLYPFVITDNSTAYIGETTNTGFEVSGSAVAQFNAGNEKNTLNILDTSMARSNAQNQFLTVQVSGNGYFLADNNTHIDSLMIWSKAAVDVNRESSVGQLQMGGQTLFAAYRNSSITGPYFLYGNVVFELEHSTASNWVSVNKPQSILTGNNATVNGTLYPSWSWRGQDGSEL
ncbi:hypothetical protein PSECIP111951_02516 [Pseudoalteromonas holothuriae]|uniref:Uncharacterized protein n=1 Tax=Pseudoalteromonas holothuriae TaxID=2963714 RepID=A0ABM9GJG7_9GAMM|nr:hypothetical protein [Pseudoalteromonas sp. CIP111951]CAH9061568.1 hypothetical protein PSECIP111951_02516 [Pseudoalteromonas sp. CIP111951]